MKRFALLLVACASLLVATSTGQGGVTVWLSPVTTIGGGASMGNPHVAAAEIGVPFQLGVWVSSPANVLKINSVALDLEQTVGGILSATGMEIMESGMIGTAARWEGSTDGNFNMSATSLFSGSNTVGVENLGLTSNGIFRSFDINYDPDADGGNGAFLFSILDIMPLTAGTTDLFLRVGARRIGYSPDSDSDISFGTGDDPVNRKVAGAISSLPDASVHVVSVLTTINVAASVADARIIVGGTTDVNVEVRNTATTGAPDLVYTVTSTPPITGGPLIGARTADGGVGYDSKTLTFTGLAPGTQLGTVTVTDPNAFNSPQSDDVTVTVLAHSNASWSDSEDSNLLVIDMGSIILGSGTKTASFSVHNLVAPAFFTAALDFDSINAVGDTGTLYTDLAGFANLDAGDSNSFTAYFDTSTLGGFGATYVLALSDEDVPGTIGGQELTLVLNGTVIPDPTVTVFLSEITTIGGGASLGNPLVDAHVGDIITLGVWVSSIASPDPNAVKVNGMALDLDETDLPGILSATSIEIMESGQPGTASRWEGTTDGNFNMSGTSLFSSSNAVGVENLGLTSVALLRGDDANYDPAADDGNGAFLFAIIELRATAVGETELFLKVGSKEIGYSPDAGTSVYFGSGDGAVDRTVEGAVSLLADAMIRVVHALGDVKGDGNADNLDITPFAFALLYAEHVFDAQYPDGAYWSADVNEDGNVDNLDITTFVDLLIAGQAIPEPGTLSVLALSALALLRRRRRT